MESVSTISKQDWGFATRISKKGKWCLSAKTKQDAKIQYEEDTKQENQDV